MTYVDEWRIIIDRVVRGFAIMDIQKTTVSELEGRNALVHLQISDHNDIEPSDQHVVFSVLVSTKPVPPATEAISFPVLQTRALKEAIALIGRVDKARQPK